MYGASLRQARAVRVRQRLLQALSGDPHWAGEDADEGVRTGGYSEGADFEDVLDHYGTSQPLVGRRKVFAKGRWRPGEEGRWRPGDYAADLPPEARSGQCALIEFGSMSRGGE